MIVAGIDPGTTTGIATWCTSRRVLLTVDSMMLHRGLELIRTLQPGLVLLEDAHGSVVSSKTATYGDAARLQGVGSVKRDCCIWEEFLTDIRVPYLAQRPDPKLTKLPAPYFKAATQWQGRTNNHARDAAMIVYGMSEAQVQHLLQLALTRAA